MSFTLGDQTPFVRYMKVYEYSEGMPGGRKQPATWLSLLQPPADMPKLPQYQIVLEIDIGLQCEDFKMIFKAKFGTKL